MIRSLFLLAVACNGAPKSFEDFYGAFQDNACQTALDGGCEVAVDTLDCDSRTSVPSCESFDASAAQLCLEGVTTCDGTTLSSVAACDLVCSDTKLGELGIQQPEVCADLIACDGALARTYTDYTPGFPDGQNDENYGVEGVCFTADLAACANACSSAYDALRELADTLDQAESITAVPEDCGGPAGPTPPPIPTDPSTPVPTPEPFTWTVTLIDGDQVADDINTVDADVFRVTIENPASAHPDVIDWELGMLKTAVPSSSRWDGEDCDGFDNGLGDVCHILPAEGSTDIDRVGSPGAVMSGSTLLDIDYPESTTAGITYVIWGYDAQDTIRVCFVQGHDPAYYAVGGCQTYLPPI